MSDNLALQPAGEQALWAAFGGLEASYLADGMPAGDAGSRSPAAGPIAPEDSALTVRPPGLAQEVRALWVTRWDYNTPGDVAHIADKAARANFNVLLFQVRGNADAYYNSRLEPWAQRLSGAPGQNPGWDPLQAAVEQGHARGLEVHAWFNVFPAWLGETPPPASNPEAMLLRFNRAYGDGWVMWDRNRQPMPLDQQYLWANPAHWAVQEQIAAVCYDLVQRYYVDGIHLDNVRYAGWEYSRDPMSLDRWEQAKRFEPDLTFKEWQRRQVNRVVAMLRRAIDRVKPGLLHSAAVWPVYQDTWDWWDAGDGYDGYCQDSIGWLRQDVMDAIMPMLYLGSITQNDEQFAVLVEDFVRRAGTSPIYAGITCTYDDFASIGRRIDLARQAGAAGQALFAYGHIDSHGYWDELRSGPYASQALVLPPPPVRKRLSGQLQAGSAFDYSSSVPF